MRAVVCTKFERKVEWECMGGFEVVRPEGKPNSLLKNGIHLYIELTLGQIHIAQRVKVHHIHYTCLGQPAFIRKMSRMLERRASSPEWREWVATEKHIHFLHSNVSSKIYSIYLCSELGYSLRASRHRLVQKTTLYVNCVCDIVGKGQLQHRPRTQQTHTPTVNNSSGVRA